jgi:hypothetical protein
VPAFFVLVFEDQLRNDPGPPGLVERHERDVGGRRVPELAGEQVLGLDPDTDLHGGAAGQVEAAPEKEQVAHEHGVMKIKPVDGRRDHVGPRVTRRHDRRSRIDQLHDHAAVNVPCRIGVLRDHHLGDGNAAVLDPFAFHERCPPGFCRAAR